MQPSLGPTTRNTRQGKKRMLSPDRADPFADSTPAPELSTYAAGGTQSRAKVKVVVISEASW